MDMWGDKFEESIKEKRKMLGKDEDSMSQVPTPVNKLTESVKKMNKVSSTASLDMFAEHADIFSDQFDVSDSLVELYVCIWNCVTFNLQLYRVPL